ncbi:MAG: beta-lactamase family protein [Gemmatimonadetes bacterium]|nr:beta-lactamase family protein [Gemmatimonadota bacterium]
MPRLRSVARLLALVAFPAFACRAGAQAPAGIEGLWGVEYRPVPDGAGLLLLDREGVRWRMRVGGREVAAPQAGDSVRLDLPGDRGTLRLAIAPDGAIRSAFWIQPPGSGPAYATPVALARDGAARWRGTVAPIADPFSLYMLVTRARDGTLLASFRNPEANFGRGRPFGARVEGDQLLLTDPSTRRVRFRQAYDSAERTIGFDFGTPLRMTPVSAEAVSGYLPRTPGAGPYAYRAPARLDDGWRVAAARDVGVDEAALTATVRRIAGGDPTVDSAARVHSVLVARHGRLVLDEYFHGFDASRWHDLRSASKTVTSILLGAAMARGVRVSPATVATPGGATVAQLLTHTSGLACDDNDEASPGNEDTMQSQRAEPDWYRFARALPQRHPPGQHYAYCSAGINLSGGVIADAARGWLPELFGAWIARPLGIAHFGMNLLPTGQGYAGGGLLLRPRDLLKLGQLYLDGGVWRGRRVVSTSWVRTSTARQQPDSAGADDGFAWHRHALRVDGRDIPSYEASGNGGQFLVVVPSLDLVVVVTAGNYGQGRVWTGLRQSLVANEVVRAVR